MEVSLEVIGQKLKERQNILILTHQNPDGDTLGSGMALYYALKQMGKRACVLCSDLFLKNSAICLPNISRRRSIRIWWYRWTWLTQSSWARFRDVMRIRSKSVSTIIFPTALRRRCDISTQRRRLPVRLFIS